MILPCCRHQTKGWDMINGIPLIEITDGVATDSRLNGTRFGGLRT